MEEKLIIELDDNKIKYGVFGINENNQYQLLSKKISENLLPNLFPKKPEIIAANSGRKTIKISILSFKIIYFFNSDRA